MPRPSRHVTWPTLLDPEPPRAKPAAEPNARTIHDDAPLAGAPLRHAAAEVWPAWEAVPPRGGGSDAWAALGRPLAIPKERDNGFFVRDLEEDFAFENVEHEVRRVES